MLKVQIINSVSNNQHDFFVAVLILFGFPLLGLFIKTIVSKIDNGI